MEKKLKHDDVAGWVILLNGEALEHSLADTRKEVRKHMNTLKSHESFKNSVFQVGKIIVSH